MNPHAKPDHFWKAFDHCLKSQFTKSQAMIMAKEFDSRGLQDASAGCMHYRLILIGTGEKNSNPA